MYYNKDNTYLLQFGTLKDYKITEKDPISYALIDAKSEKALANCEARMGSYDYNANTVYFSINFLRCDVDMDDHDTLYYIYITAIEKLKERYIPLGARFFRTRLNGFHRSEYEETELNALKQLGFKLVYKAKNRLMESFDEFELTVKEET